ncbi:MAG: cytochrome c oxidase accessory protein CcoG [Alphaproteobacteria bacterium]
MLQHVGHTVHIEDAVSVTAGGKRPLYAKRIPVHPKKVSGIFRRLKWTALIGLLGIYYAVPWIRWDRGPGVPDQAVLIDLPSRRAYFFWIEIWPQEVYYITGILILAAVGLFFITSLGGRLWCGYACPQTVWTDLYVLVERWIEGDRHARITLDNSPLTLDKARKRVSKHAVWLVIAMLTGGAWVLYFTDAPTVVREIFTLQASSTVWGTIGFLTCSTYLLAGWAREQVCTYMCPYARFQSAMFDEHTLIVTYQKWRGEPRGRHTPGQSWEGRGHCVNCNLCVAVCPTGIDIRDGQQLECIGCGLCMDACDSVMDKVGLPRSLITLDTEANQEAREAGIPPRYRFVRPRTVIYGTMLVLVGALMLYTLLTRSDFSLNVIHDRSPMYVILSDGSLRNAYTIKILNKRHVDSSLVLTAEGIEGADLRVVSNDEHPSDALHLTAAPDSVSPFRVLVHAPRQNVVSASTPLTFVLRDDSTGDKATYRAAFLAPKR